LPVVAAESVAPSAQRGPLDFPERAKKMFEIGATFGITMKAELDDNGEPILDANGKKIPKKRMITGYAEPTQWTPAIDPGYVFSDEDTKMILFGFENKDRILIHGHSGTGKTSCLEQIAARLNYNVIKINFDGAIQRADLVGEWIVKGQEMTFMYGVLPMAFRMPGTLIILDEWDTISGECAFVLQRPLQKDDGKLLLMETGGTLIPLHEDNVIAATANTRGFGDDTGLYTAGTRVQNFSQLNRFSITINMKYLSAEQEEQMLKMKIPGLEPIEYKGLVLTVNKIRQAYENGEMSVPLSPRDLLNWAEKYLHIGDVNRAALYCFLNRMPVEDAATAAQIIQRQFGA
jgi:cobaltochelatase CobS